MRLAAARTGAFGALTPLMAPKSIAVIGASDREGNLGGLAVSYLVKFGFPGSIWPVNAGRDQVAGLRCYSSIGDLPSTPDLAILAVPANSVIEVVKECIEAKVPAAVVWAGGFAEGEEAGKTRQRALEDVCRNSDIKLCGPNCIGIINTSMGMTASFSSLMSELDHFIPGAVSIVSQSGGISVTAHARAQELGFGFRCTISCGNEAVLGIPDFIKALVEDEGTRVIAVYTEGISDPAAFVEALAFARERQKPVVILKGGATEASVRAALAHTGRLAGLDRTADAIFREFAAIRVFSTEEMLDVCLQLASLKPGQLPKSNRVLLSSFGGGSGVIGTDQCAREGLEVPPLDAETRECVKSIFSPLGSSANPIDLTPGSMTNPKYRAHLPTVLKTFADAPNIDSFLFFSAGFGTQAPELVEIFEDLRRHTDKPVHLSWLSPPAGILPLLAKRGVRAFDEHARAIRAAAHVARYGTDMQHRIHRMPNLTRAFDWSRFVSGSGPQVVSEDVVSAILEAAELPVAKGRFAAKADAAVAAARAVGYPVAIKGISSAITHRAAAGLVALGIDSDAAVRRTVELFGDRAALRNVTLDGVWVQHMVSGGHELLVTAFRDREFGVMIGCGMGGGMTEIIDDVVFTRAPIDRDGAFDLIARLRTLKRMPNLIGDEQRLQAAGFLSDFSRLVASAPWERFTFEVNPLKLGAQEYAAVDGLLIIE